MAKYGFAIRLDRCIGCGVCGLACKTENNTHYKVGGTTFNWADYYTKTIGSYTNGNFHFRVYPVTCNHCSQAPCVEVCPTGALFKDANNLTMHDESKCTGTACGHLCIVACPYSNLDVDAEGVQYSVLQAGNGEQAAYWAGTTELEPGATSSPAGMVTAAGNTPPYRNEFTHQYYSDVRPTTTPGLVEKCFRCDHRLQQGLNPWCVDSCPAEARVFGDLNDPDSELSQLLQNNKSYRLKNNQGEFLDEKLGETGTDPQLWYIDNYGPGPGPINVKEVKKEFRELTVFPNPATDKVSLEFELPGYARVTVALYDMNGKKAMKPIDKGGMTAGSQKIDLDVSSLQAGTYICRIIADKNIFTKNIVVSR